MIFNNKIKRNIKKIPGLLEAKECVRFQFLKENQKKITSRRLVKFSRSHALATMIT